MICQREPGNHANAHLEKMKNKISKFRVRLLRKKEVCEAQTRLFHSMESLRQLIQTLSQGIGVWPWLCFI